MNCDTEKLYEPICGYLLKISDGEKLNSGDDKALRHLLCQYWATSCPEDNPCRPNTCLFARPENWIAFHGYESALDLLDNFDYENVKVLKIKCKNSIDALDVWGARLPGNPT